jgi:hypothetical protein
MASHQNVGSLSGAMRGDERAVQSASRTRRALGDCWIVYGLIRLVVAAAMFVWSAIATVMFGALLNRVPDPSTLMAIFHAFYWGMAILAVLGGVLGLLAGVALIRGQRSARGLAISAGVVALPDLPLGTALGGYTLAALLPARVAWGDTPNNAPWTTASPTGVAR